MEDTNQYRCLKGKVIYYMVALPNTIYVVKILSQFIQEPSKVY